MRQKLVLILLLAFMGANAQMKQSTFVFGPKVGINPSHIKIIDNPSATTTSGLALRPQVGIFTRLNFGRLTFQPEGIFQIKGGNLKSPNEKHAYHYISTPILAGFSPFQGFHIETGPEYSWALNKDYKKNSVLQFGPNKATEKAWVGGIRLDMLDAFSMFSINLRYTHGLENVITKAYDDKTNFDFRTRTYQLSVTYNFSEYYKWYKKYGVKKSKK